MRPAGASTPRVADSPVRELASGVDALYLSGRASVPLSLFECLALRRELAEGTGATIPYDLGGVEFGLAPHGWRKYRYCLEHRYGRVGLTPSSTLPAIRVQPRAEFLHGVGARPAVQWFDDVLSAVCGPVRWSVSRLDLHGDFQGWELCGDDRHRFLARADARGTRELGARLTGFEFGRRSTNTISARVYDKAAERAAKGEGLGYLEEIWEGYEPGSPVFRVEFEFGREGLRQFDVSSPDEVIDAAGALWAYATHEWLTFRTPSSDWTPSRWPVAPEWVQVQRARIGESAAGLERLYAASSAASFRAILPGLVGYLAAAGFHLGLSGIDDTCAAIPGLLRDYEIVSKRSFGDRIAERSRKAAFS